MKTHVITTEQSQLYFKNLHVGDFFVFDDSLSVVRLKVSSNTFINMSSDILVTYTLVEVGYSRDSAVRKLKQVKAAEFEIVSPAHL